MELVNLDLGDLNIKLEKKKIKNKFKTIVYGIPSDKTNSVLAFFKSKLGCNGFLEKDKENVISLSGDQIDNISLKYKNTFKSITK